MTTKPKPVTLVVLLLLLSACETRTRKVSVCASKERAAFILECMRAGKHVQPVDCWTAANYNVPESDCRLEVQFFEISEFRSCARAAEDSDIQACRNAGHR